MNKCPFKVADQCHWSTPTRQRQKELTHSVCRFFLRRTPHPAACECSSSQQPAARRRWLKFPSRCLRGRWPPWHTRPDTGALRTNDTQCCQDEDANPKQWKARHLKQKNKKQKKTKTKHTHKLPAPGLSMSKSDLRLKNYLKKEELTVDIKSNWKKHHTSHLTLWWEDGRSWIISTRLKGSRKQLKSNIGHNLSTRFTFMQHEHAIL